MTLGHRVPDAVAGPGGGGEGQSPPIRDNQFDVKKGSFLVIVGPGNKCN